MYLALWLIRRWRLPATPCFTLPVAVSLKRFFTPLLVFSLGIFVSLPPHRRTSENSHGSPCRRAVRFFHKLESRRLYGRSRQKANDSAVSRTGWRRCFRPR